MSHAKPYLLITISILLGWGIFLLLGPINDDFQILGYHLPNLSSLWDVFQPFWSEDISKVYYRPIPNTLHRLVLFAFGESIVAFRVVSLFLYLLLTFSVYHLLYTATDGNRTFSAWMAVLFSLIPSHWYYTGWIAGNGDLLIAIFAAIGMTCLIQANAKSDSGIEFRDSQRKPSFSLNIELTFLFCVAASALTKEHGYMLALAPFCFYAIYKCKTYLTLGLISSIIVLSVFWLGGVVNTEGLAQSNNLADISAINVIKNFLLSLALGFIDHRGMSSVSQSLATGGFLILALSLVSLVVYALVKLSGNRVNSPEYPASHYSPLIRTLMLVVVCFSIPALPYLMPWYSLYISVPVFIILAVIGNRVYTEGSESITRAMKVVFGAMIVCLVCINICKGYYSVVGAEYLEDTVQSSAKLLGEEADSIVIVGYPKRISGVNAMVSGKQQFIQKMMGIPLGLIPDIDMRAEIEIQEADLVGSYYRYDSVVGGRAFYSLQPLDKKQSQLIRR